MLGNYPEKLQSACFSKLTFSKKLFQEYYQSVLKRFGSRVARRSVELDLSPSCLQR